MDKLSLYDTEQPSQFKRRSLRDSRFRLLAGILTIALILATLNGLDFRLHSKRSSKVPLHASETLQKCRMLDVKPAPPVHFVRRRQSDRFVPGTKPTLLRNATIWTGRASGQEVIKGDLLLDKGLIKAVGNVKKLLDDYKAITIFDATGAWVSPGCGIFKSFI